MILDNAVADIQSQAHTRADGLCCEEGVKDLVLVSGFNSCAIVLACQQNATALQARTNSDALFVGALFTQTVHGVLEQVNAEWMS